MTRYVAARFRSSIRFTVLRRGLRTVQGANWSECTLLPELDGRLLASADGDCFALCDPSFNRSALFIIIPCCYQQERHRVIWRGVPLSQAHCVFQRVAAAL